MKSTGGSSAARSGIDPGLAEADWQRRNSEADWDSAAGLTEAGLTETGLTETGRTEAGRTEAALAEAGIAAGEADQRLGGFGHVGDRQHGGDDQQVVAGRDTLDGLAL